MRLKRLMKSAIQDIVKAISGEVPATFTEEGLKRISAATYNVTMLADCVAFTETLQRHKYDFSSLLQHMVDCNKALFADESICTSTCVHLFTWQTSLRVFIHYERILLQLPCPRITHC